MAASGFPGSSTPVLASASIFLAGCVAGSAVTSLIVWKPWLRAARSSDADAGLEVVDKQPAEPLAEQDDAITRLGQQIAAKDEKLARLLSFTTSFSGPPVAPDMDTPRGRSVTSHSLKSLSRSNSTDSLGSCVSASGGRLKLVLLVRGDVGLDMRKAVVQGARTVLGMFKKLYKRKDASIQAWDRSGGMVVCLRAENEKELMHVQSEARVRAIPTHTYKDRGTYRTVMAVGPADGETLHELTGHLKLL